MIPVTKTFIPPIESYTEIISRAFNNGWLTNRGELVKELEQELIKFLELRDSKILCVNNGTIPLQIALKLIGNGGEVITTPFSYVATTSAILWENCTPVFVDIHPEYLTIDETKIEEAITEKTTCILATHVYGNPCNVDEIQRIANKYGLKVIYDGAHAFGVKYKGLSIFEYGDVTTCSFHATKLFHTGEGGAVFCKNQELYDRIYDSHNFGHDGQNNFNVLGINGKMSELSAAMGISLLPFIPEILFSRKKSIEYYNLHLCESFGRLKLRDESIWNYSYYPVIIKDLKTLQQLEIELNSVGVFSRRYFYPSLNLLSFLKGDKMPISEDIASRVVCLPLFCGMTHEELNKICLVVNNYRS